MDSHLPNMTATVIGFARMTEQELDSVRRDLGLSLSVGDLRRLQRVYAKHPPVLDELFLFDALATHRTLMGDTALTELFCQDAPVADTYAHMMALYSRAYPHDTRPPSLGRLATLSREALGEQGLSMPLVLRPDHSALPLSPRPSRMGDVLTLLLPEEGEDRTAFLARASALLRKTLPFEAWDLLPLTEDADPLGVLLDACYKNGLYLEPDRLSDGLPQSTATLLDVTRRGLTVRTSTPDKDKLLAAAAGQIRAISYAKFVSEPHLAVRRTDGKRYAIPLDDLLSFRHYPAQTARIGRQTPPAALSALRHRDPRAPITPLYATREGGAFYGVLYTAIAAVCSLVAMGIPREQARLKVTHTLEDLREASPQAMGERMAAYLGLYRASCELVVPSHLSFSQGSERMIATYGFAARHGAKRPSPLLTTPGASLYLFKTPYGEDGLPDFGALRALMCLMEDRIARGRVLAARAVHGDLVRSLAAMQAGTMTLIPTLEMGNEAVPLPPGSFLVEATDPEEGKGGLLIGHVVQKPLDKPL